jgi:hypothetical protein
MNLTREDIHQLVDALPDNELPAAKRYLQFLQSVGQSPALESMVTAPWDDEPETDEEIEAVREAYEDVKRDEMVSDHELDSLLRR